MKWTIGKKLNLLLAGLLLSCLSGVVIVTTQLTSNDLIGLLRREAIDSSGLLSGRIRAELLRISERAQFLASASLEEFKETADKAQFIEESLTLDPRFVAVSLYSANDSSPQWRVIQPLIPAAERPSVADLDTLQKTRPIDIAAIARGEHQFFVDQLKTGLAVIRMGIPFMEEAPGRFSQVLVIDLRQETLTELFAEAAGSLSYLVGPDGAILGSSDPTRIEPGLRIPDSAIVKEAARTTDVNSGQIDFKDLSGEMQIGAFHKVGFARLLVVSQTPLSRVQDARRQIFERMILLSGFFLLLALAVGAHFSLSIAKPIEALSAAAEKVARGDFSVRLAGIQQAVAGRFSDEIHRFSHTFDQMVSGLKDRDKAKSALVKYHSKEIAEKMMTGDLKVGGERKECVVFFSDVRDFTAMSERLDPHHLVSILNRYFARMIKVLSRYDGLVVRFQGDGIMAVWGIPQSKPDNIENAINCCLGMRKALVEFNEELILEGREPLRIGMGLHYGQVVAGNIGSESRLEYTVIGDTVNTASRIESATKEFGTDLLVSEAILSGTKRKLVIEKVLSKLKGKTQPITMYKIHGFIDSKGIRQLVTTPYSAYEPSKLNESIRAHHFIEVDLEIEEPTLVDQVHEVTNTFKIKKAS